MSRIVAIKGHPDGKHFNQSGERIYLKKVEKDVNLATKHPVFEGSSESEIAETYKLTKTENKEEE